VTRKNNLWTDKAANKIAKAVIWLQKKFAHVMNKQFSKMPQKKLKRILIVFCLLSGGFSIYLAASAIFGSEKKQSAIRIDHLDIPAHLSKTGSEINEGDNMVSEELYRSIQQYKQYMDSTSQLIRSSLMDSIKLLEHIYTTQNFKK
jgi:hypothetical protein